MLVSAYRINVLKFSYEVCGDINRVKTKGWALSKYMEVETPASTRQSASGKKSKDDLVGCYTTTLAQICHDQAVTARERSQEHDLFHEPQFPCANNL